ncbi:MAG: sigma-70 family RNA polymerase sigma factor [Loktanella sp.]|nr:sigma-70 family RNA polymerase sigma factor [Loktanella sp.]
MNTPVMNFVTCAGRGRTADMLSAVDERNLIRAWQGHGDKRARDRLINAFTPLATSVAKRFKRGTTEPDPDLVQQAHIGLMKAADKFDPERDIRFSTYAVWWVRAEIKAFAQANVSVVRRPQSVRSRRAAVHIASLDAEMTADSRIDRLQADARLAAALGIDTNKAADLRAQVTGRDHSLNVPALGDEGEDRIALVVDPASLGEPLPFRGLEAAALRRVLVEALSKLPDRERDIIVATQVLTPSATLDDLGSRYGISGERVRQLRERGFAKLRESLQRCDVGQDYFT